ncbi:cytochrome P450 9e2-like [Harmonia axyridis]|uniref:cytochrome P450 9e2-like n=1 Tax=Harmonia axyridis TaxID=115357 RepID=UPI001E277BAE|nr:cytochrome P450 9e2-like [Harmonia axyridis]
MNIFDVLSGFFFLLLLLLSVFIYICCTVDLKPFYYWSSKGVRTAKILPVIGDAIFGICFSKKPYPKLIQDVYDSAGNSRYIGYSELRTPILMIKSPELIGKLFVRDAENFQDRRVVFLENFDTLMSKTLVHLRGQEWKNIRGIWNMVLTTSKVERMYPLIYRMTESFVTSFNNVEKNEVKTFNVKTVYRKYICDLSASIYFGIDKDFDIFRVKLSNFVNFNGNSIWTLLSFCVACLAPKLSILFGVSSIVNKDVHEYFLKIVSESLEKEDINKHRSSLMDSIHKLKQEEQSENLDGDIKRAKIDLNEDEIVSQLCMFLFSSLDGLLPTLIFITYELAINPNVQQKLQDEMDQIRVEGDLPEFHNIMGLQYLNMVISETMRKWPSVTMTDRLCTKPYTIETVHPEEKPLHLDIGDCVAVSLYALHHDPKYFPKPDTFDPERFSGGNRHKIKPFTYLPWGIGPRNCNAQKLSLLILKVFFFQLLEHLEVIPIDETVIPIELQKGVIKVEPKCDILLGLRKREDL